MVSNGNTLGIYSNWCSHRHARVFMWVFVWVFELSWDSCSAPLSIMCWNSIWQLTGQRMLDKGEVGAATRQALWRIGFAWDSIWLIELNCICRATKTNSRERGKNLKQSALPTLLGMASDSWLRYAAAFPAGYWMQQKFMHFSSPVCFSLAVWESAPKSRLAVRIQFRFLLRDRVSARTWLAAYQPVTFHSPPPPAVTPSLSALIRLHNTLMLVSCLSWQTEKLLLRKLSRTLPGKTLQCRKRKKIKKILISASSCAALASCSSFSWAIYDSAHWNYTNRLHPLATDRVRLPFAKVKVNIKPALSQSKCPKKFQVL